MASAVQSVHGDGSPERTGRGSNNEYLRIAQLSISPREQINHDRMLLFIYHADDAKKRHNRLRRYNGARAGLFSRHTAYLYLPRPTAGGA